MQLLYAGNSSDIMTTPQMKAKKTLSGLNKRSVVKKSLNIYDVAAVPVVLLLLRVCCQCWVLCFYVVASTFCWTVAKIVHKQKHSNYTVCWKLQAYIGQENVSIFTTRSHGRHLRSIMSYSTHHIYNTV